MKVTGPRLVKKQKKQQPEEASILQDIYFFRLCLDDLERRVRALEKRAA
jgi:hypothetical protein